MDAERGGQSWRGIAPSAGHPPRGGSGLALRRAAAARKGSRRARRSDGMRFGAHRRCTRLGGLAAAAAGCVLLAGCGSSHRAGQHAGHRIPVVEHDFHIEAPSRLAAGTYTFEVENDGATDHELIIAPSPDGRLPLRADGLTVDEEAIESEEPGSLEPGPPGAKRALTVHLSPGRYTFFCNMEGHFMAGMHTEVVVG